MDCLVRLLGGIPVRGLCVLICASAALLGQAIQFESGGLYYQTLTRAGVTIMFAELPVQVREFAVIQVAVSNGSPSSRTVKAEDFKFIRADRHASYEDAVEFSLAKAAARVARHRASTSGLTA